MKRIRDVRVGLNRDDAELLAKLRAGICLNEHGKNVSDAEVMRRGLRALAREMGEQDA